MAIVGAAGTSLSLLGIPRGLATESSGFVIGRWLFVADAA